tara:strand:+ start:490 stop:828 length:339 start_codon:yes stop_codon:yes gene_type:complete
MEKIAYPCPCGGKIKWKKERIIRDGIDCGILEIEVCPECGEEYLPDESLKVVEQKLKKHGLWGVKRKEIKFWKSGNAVVIRLPTEISKRLKLNQIKKGYVYEEGEGKLAIDY